MKRTASTLDFTEPTAQRIRIQSPKVRIVEKTYARYVFRHNSTFIDPWIGFTVTFTSITITEYNNSTGSNNATIREIGEESEPVEAENMDAGNDKMDISSIWQKRRMSPEGEFFRLFFN